jgi:hypothetical protein
MIFACLELGVENSHLTHETGKCKAIFNRLLEHRYTYKSYICKVLNITLQYNFGNSNQYFLIEWFLLVQVNVKCEMTLENA